MLKGDAPGRAVGGGEGPGQEVGPRVMSGSMSTESMNRLDHLRYDSYTGHSGWEPGRPSLEDRGRLHRTGAGGSSGNNLDDIDYMSEEGDEDEVGLSGDELNSGASGSLRGRSVALSGFLRPANHSTSNVQLSPLLRVLNAKPSLLAVRLIKTNQQT